MAIEDGVVLGQEVGGGGAVEEILQRFMKRRFKRDRLVVESSVEIGEMLRRGEPMNRSPRRTPSAGARSARSKPLTENPRPGSRNQATNTERDTVTRDHHRDIAQA